MSKKGKPKSVPSIDKLVQFNGGSKPTKAAPRCYEGHPPLPIGEFLIYGGSCSMPIVKDADVYVGFDYTLYNSGKEYPWAEGHSFQYKITDMCAPADPVSFKKLIEWLSVQLIAQKKVHIGCIGGHGRTGLVLAALVTYMTGELDSITYVRKHYCVKAVESAAQIDFLNAEFGIKKVTASKGGYSFDDYPVRGGTSMYSGETKEVFKPAFKGTNGGRQRELIPSTTSKASTMAAMPTTSPLSIWGRNISFDKALNTDTITV